MFKTTKIGKTGNMNAMSKLSFPGMLLCFLMTGILGAGNVQSQGTSITMQLEGVNLHAIFEVLEEQTDYTFSYAASVRDIEPVSVNADEEPLDAILSDLEIQAGVTFNRVGRMIAVTNAEVPEKGTAAKQNASINGYITDQRSGETLLAANIALIEINRGTSTNNSGYYTINNIPPGTYTLVATYVGYQRYEQEISVKEGENRRIDIKLTPQNLQLDELVVQSETEKEEQKNIGRAQISTQLMEELPSVMEPDVFRSVQLLPGVKAASDFSSGLYIRGGSPDQTLILLDETTVYNPSHLFGFFSTFNPDAVKNVQLFKGGYPAEYGGRIGSVLTVYNKDGNRNETSGTVSLGMLASRASIEGPYKHGSYMLAVRRSTIEPVLALIDDAPETFYFYDVNGKLNFDVSQDNRLSLAFYSGTDVISWPILEDASIDLNYGNQTVSAQWRSIISDKLFSTVTATGSRYFNEPEFQISGTSFESENNVHDFSLKADLEYNPNEHHTFSAGFWGGAMTLSLQELFDNEYAFDRRLHSRYFSAYVKDQWKPSSQWIATGGLRLNAFSKGEYVRMDPRLSLEYRPTEAVRLQAAYGRYNQFLTLMTNEAFSGFDTWLTTAENVPPSYGDQFSLGMKTNLFKGYGLDVEVYYRTMKDLFELDPFVSDNAGLDYEEQFRFGEGYAYGMEVFVEKQIGRLSGFVGYTFGVTRRKFPGFNIDIPDGPRRGRFYPPKYDRTHDVNIVARYRLSQRWRASAVFNYSTGQAYTDPQGRTQFADVPWGRSDHDAFVIGNVNSSRLPSYHRMDLSFSRAGSFFNLADAEWKFQLINLYNRSNIWFYNYDFDENPVKREDVTMLPTLPAISYTVNF